MSTDEFLENSLKAARENLKNIELSDKKKAAEPEAPKIKTPWEILLEAPMLAIGPRDLGQIIEYRWGPISTNRITEGNIIAGTIPVKPVLLAVAWTDSTFRDYILGPTLGAQLITIANALDSNLRPKIARNIKVNEIWNKAVTQF